MIKIYIFSLKTRECISFKVGSIIPMIGDMVETKDIDDYDKIYKRNHTGMVVERTIDLDNEIANIYVE